MPYRPSLVQLRVVTLLRRAEHLLDGGVVVEEREEHRNAFHDGGPQLRLDPHPVVVEPAFDGVELRALANVTDFRRTGLTRSDS